MKINKKPLTILRQNMEDWDNIFYKNHFTIFQEYEGQNWDGNLGMAPHIKPLQNLASHTNDGSRDSRTATLYAHRERFQIIA